MGEAYGANAVDEGNIDSHHRDTDDDGHHENDRYSDAATPGAVVAPSA